MSAVIDDSETPVVDDTKEVSKIVHAVEGVHVLHAGNNAGLAVIEQTGLIPTNGPKKTTTKWEYWTYCVFYYSPNGAPIASNGASILQLLISLQFPNDQIPWGGNLKSMDSLVLDVSGIIFAVQLVLLLIIGTYADYGNWRPWILIIAQSILVICQFAAIGVTDQEKWRTSEALYIIGMVANNVVIAFYSACLPGIAADQAHVQESAEAVLRGEKSPEAHEELDAYERGCLSNTLNWVGSSVQVVLFSAAVGIAAAAGYATNQQLIRSYQILMGFFGACCLGSAVPFFIAQQNRPGQQLPAGTKPWTAGPRQVWDAMRSIGELRQIALYLFAFFMLQETYGTYYTVTNILQNQVISYSPVILNALNVVGNLTGGAGNLVLYLLQKRFHFTTKQGIMYGGFMTLVPNLWGAIGTFQNKVGFHHPWEFWVAQAWNFQMAAWNSYQISLLSEIIPAPKVYMFFALFNTVGKTSAFVGPFVSSGISARAGGNTNAAYWFLLGMGTAGYVALYFVNPQKAKVDNAKFLEREAEAKYGAVEVTLAPVVNQLA